MASRKGTSLLVLQTASSAFRMLRERARAGNPRSAWVACRKRPTHKGLVILSGVRRGGRSRRTCGCSCLCISRDRMRTDRPVSPLPISYSLLLRRAQSHARTQSLIPAPFTRAKVTSSRHFVTYLGGQPDRTLASRVQRLATWFSIRRHRRERHVIAHNSTR